MEPSTSQGSVTSHYMQGVTLIDTLPHRHFTADLQENVPVKKIGKSATIWQNYGHELGV